MDKIQFFLTMPFLWRNGAYVASAGTSSPIRKHAFSGGMIAAINIKTSDSLLASTHKPSSSSIVREHIESDAYGNAADHGKRIADGLHVSMHKPPSRIVRKQLEVDANGNMDNSATSFAQTASPVRKQVPMGIVAADGVVNDSVDVSAETSTASPVWKQTAAANGDIKVKNDHKKSSILVQVAAKNTSMEIDADTDRNSSDNEYYGIKLAAASLNSSLSDEAVQESPTSKTIVNSNKKTLVKKKKK